MYICILQSLLLITINALAPQVGTMSNEIFEVDERSMTQRLIVQVSNGSNG